MGYFDYTGNPFVDAGISSMLAYLNKKNPQDIDDNDLEKIKNLLVELYLKDKWNKSLFSIFPNSKVTNPAIKDKKKEYSSFLENLIEEIKSIDNGDYCVSCGKNKVKIKYSKSYIPLIGSGSFRNFFSNLIDGERYCAGCVFAIQASPLSYYTCGKYFALIHSSDYSIQKSWARICINDIQKQISTNNYTGCYNENYSNAVNALFNIADKLIDEYSDEIEEGSEIMLYKFTNYNQAPELFIYRLPDKVFKFLKKVYYLPNRQEWNRLIKKGYVLTKKIKEDDEEKIKNQRNNVYERLLNNESIVRYFFIKGKREIIGDFRMFSLYLKEVLGLDEKRIEVIKNLADNVSEYIKKTEKLNRLYDLEKADTRAKFANVLLKITKDKLKMNEDKPLITMEEYVNYIVNEGNFRESQDIMLFRIYENLFEWFKGRNLTDLEDEEDK
ncbi:type I-B CRISPR-associated protein Cas8b1/Cst1 [Caloramator proteoclasticus]|uniref:CRISPR-associated protein, Cst1 family n=1 Tax=Caloramator proteoclasticus DSM 10124 TaxID=1121262 RepID=A0A1M4ZN24_9CLOT|nr:type I-B CRISPR-associated protein Cas8b1/Cst1 [Caloramator proteoclasticus]SHF19325.1 CRISPR-associated protein, Cst1 family [Caloramator proteoclasticus DSM 10124]